jgi:ABC-2 type transport system ATP-binding protein
MAMEPAIAFHGVTREFGTVRAVDGLDLAVYPGELVALVGPDGAGKTTAARLAAGALAPTRGRVEPESRGRVGYLTGRFSLYSDLSVWENLRFFARIYGMSAGEVHAEGGRLLEWVDLTRFRERMAGALSGGMRQKLALCCALIHRPPVLILDEPTTAVDPVARADFWALLRERAADGQAILVTTPYLDEAENGHRIGLLDRGRLLATGTALELKDRLPYRMAMLTPEDGLLNRREATAAAAALPGRRWAQPMGTGVRVALALPEGAPTAGSTGAGVPGAGPTGAGLAGAPPGYRLHAVPVTLEDVYIWLSGTLEEVEAR